jgi:thiol-disulfide isomerase/thioredoxin
MSEGPTSPQSSPPNRRPSRRQEQNRQLTQQRRAVEQLLRPWWQSPPALAGGALAVVVVVVVLILLLGRAGATGGPATPAAAVPASVLSAVTAPDPSVIAAVGKGGQPGELTRVAGTQVLEDAGGKPTVVYVGAEYCPYCAAERWSVIMALSRFGRFAGLGEMTSSSTDAYPNTSTFTFVRSSYSSQWVDFQPTELEDRNEQPLQSPSAQVAQVFQNVDKPPYTADAQGYPFLDIGGRFALYETSYSPQVLQGLSWQQIAADLSNPSSPVTQAIVGNANYLTAATCASTGNQPASVCSSPTIRGIESTLDAQAPVSG